MKFDSEKPDKITQRVHLQARNDLDLFVIQKTHETHSARTIKRLLFGVIHQLDAHVLTPEELERTDPEELSFTWVIARQARLYYWNEEASPSLQIQSDRN
jgi:hypothetical protein